jgi:hypothetical protein
VETTLLREDAGRYDEFTERVLGVPGQSLRRFNGLVRELMGLPPAPAPRARPLPDPVESVRAPELGSHWCTVRFPSGAGGRVTLERFPVVAGQSPPITARDPFLLLDMQHEIDETRRSNAEVIVDSEAQADRDARAWLSTILARYPAAVLAAVRLDNGCALLFSDRTAFKVDSDDPAVAAAALYAWRVAGRTGEAQRLEVALGARTVEFTVQRSTGERPAAEVPRLPRF